MVDKALLDQVMRLPAEERLELADALWASAADHDPVLTDEWRTLLDEAQDDAEAHPERLIPWDRVRTELFARLRR